MAQPCRRPLLSFLYPSPPCLYRPRPFSTGRPRQQQKAGGMAMQLPKQRPQQSMQMRQKEQMADANAVQIPNDLGLMEGTFVMPTGSNRPSLLREPRLRWKLELERIKARIRDLGGLIYYKFSIRKAKPRPRLFFPRSPLRHPLGFLQRASLAKALHAQMYAAFAAGDAGTLRRICADGLLASFRARIGQRPPGERLAWTLHAYVGRPRVVSDRASPVPLAPETGLRQVVVRIRSRQSLARTAPSAAAGEGWTRRLSAAGRRVVGQREREEREEREKGRAAGEGAPVGEEPAQIKDVTEYVVIQRRIWKGVEEPWIVWGMTEETTAEKLLAKEAAALKA